MDPNKLLEEIRNTLKLRLQDKVTLGDLQDMSDAVIALDEWLTNGGFLPEDWRRQAHRTRWTLEYELQEEEDYPPDSQRTRDADHYLEQWKEDKLRDKDEY